MTDLQAFLSNYPTQGYNSRSHGGCTSDQQTASNVLESLVRFSYSSTQAILNFSYNYMWDI